MLGKDLESRLIGHTQRLTANALAALDTRGHQHLSVPEVQSANAGTARTYSMRTYAWGIPVGVRVYMQLYARAPSCTHLTRMSDSCSGLYGVLLSTWPLCAFSLSASFHSSAVASCFFFSFLSVFIIVL